ncbi:MAG: hydroxymethylglutaryl-CoA lyase [Bacteroidales bacterium]|nr:hydroxymethylglutaryl-CoA lyase [Bacteroidales bacterium]
MLKILETPRDAIQGLKNIIPSSKKVELINTLLQVGFDIIDIGSFVSSKAIPQLSDTEDVIKRIDISGTQSKLFVLTANTKGGEKAAQFEQISYIGFPFSISPVFLKRNINSDFNKALKTIDEIQNTCLKSKKKLIVYLTMAFGNPYGDPSGKEIILHWTEILSRKGIETISLSDIIGVATPEMIKDIYASLSKEFSGIEFGIHLHIKKDDWYDKIDAAYKNGCKIFDGVINGIGGCPMTGYELLGNLPTGNILEYAQKNNISLTIDKKKFTEAQVLAFQIAEIRK